MFKFTKFEIFPIKTLSYEKDWSNERCKELLPVAVEGDINNWGDMLRVHHETIRAGMGKYKVFGLEIYIYIESNEEEDQICPLFVDYFLKRFNIKNVLSIKFVRDGDDCAFGILIYPQVLRALAPEEWFLTMDGDNFTYTNEMLLQMHDIFSNALQCDVDFDKNMHFVSDKVGSIAEIDLIKDIDYEHENDYEYKIKIYDATGSAKQAVHDMTFPDYQRMVRNAVTYFTTGVEKNMYLQVQTGNISVKEFMDAVKKYLHRMKEDITDRDEKQVLDEVHVAVFGNYILEPLLNDENISDIKVLSPDEIRVKCNGVRMTSNVNFTDIEDMNRFFHALELRYGFDYQDRAIHRTTDLRSNDKFIMRINVTTPTINSNGMYNLHIRKIRKTKMTSEELIRHNCMPRHVYEYLRHKINTSSILFCGKGGSGKTTMMNTLIEDIGWDKSGLVIQESEELFSAGHPDFMFQHIVDPVGNSRGYSLQDEARNGLLTDLDYFIIGEIKGGEALYFLNAAMTGHKCMCSVHAPDSKSAIDKLADYVMYESPYNKEQAMYMLKEMKVLVYMENFKVKEISEIVGYDNEKKELIFKMVYKL